MRIGGLLKALTVIAKLIANFCSEIEFYSDSFFNFKCQLEDRKDLNSNLFSKIKNNEKVSNIINDSKVSRFNNNIHSSQIQDSSPDKDIFANNKKFSQQTLNNNLLLNNSYTAIKGKERLEIVSKSVVISKLDRNSKEKYDKRLLTNTLAYYPNCSAFKNFLGQIFGFFYCKFNFNKEIMYFKLNYRVKINKLLSVNYIFKKFFEVEFISMQVLNNFNKEDLNLHSLYLNQLTSDSSYLKYDDSEIFVF